LWAFGPNVVKGYWNRPDASAAQFRDGWVKTGDLASIDDEGFCTIVDRATDMVIRGGANIYCSEVELVLARHPAVADAALVGLPDPVLGEVPAALVQARGPVSEETLRAFACQYLAAYKVPVRILVSAAPLPRNEGGKLVRRDLVKAFGR
jgi:acyl-CoA synthetase (AMP-forming)/AMP-acid ligase II